MVWFRGCASSSRWGRIPEAACSPGLGQACVSTAEVAAGQGWHAGAVLLQPAERTVGAEAV